MNPKPSSMISALFMTRAGTFYTVARRVGPSQTDCYQIFEGRRFPGNIYETPFIGMAVNGARALRILHTHEADALQADKVRMQKGQPRLIENICDTVLDPNYRQFAATFGVSFEDKLVLPQP